MSSKALAQDMYIEELERNLSDAARLLLVDNGCQGSQSQQLTAWLNTAAVRASYSHRHRTHIQVSDSLSFGTVLSGINILAVQGRIQGVSRVSGHPPF